MKHILHYIGALLFVFTAVSCEKTLQEKPKTILNPDQFFNNPSSYETTVMGIYGGLPLYVAQTHEMITDLYAAPSSQVEQAMPVYNNQPSPSYYNARSAWNGPYDIIKNANFILQYLPDASLAESKKNALIGEALLLRAYAFFDLVQLFGDVPMPLELAPNYDNLRLPRTPAQQVYEQVIEDLKYAEVNLPDEKPQEGRADKWVAKALLARVYLTMTGNPFHKEEFYELAFDKAKEVIESGKFQLMENYEDVFHRTSYSSETIWEKQYVPGRGGNSLHNATCTAEGYTPSLVPSVNFIESFPEGDQRRAWGVREKYEGPKGELTRPFFHKFVDTSMIDRGVLPSSASVSYSVPLIRLAEMYLIAAEAENALRGPSGAYDYINRLRRRARVDKSNLNHVPDFQGLSKEELEKEIWKEWDRELYLEGFSWKIMKRTDSFDRIEEQRGGQLTVPIGPYNQTWPIPVEEITNNNIPQNPLYR